MTNLSIIISKISWPGFTPQQMIIISSNVAFRHIMKITLPYTKHSLSLTSSNFYPYYQSEAKLYSYLGVWRDLLALHNPRVFLNLQSSSHANYCMLCVGINDDGGQRSDVCFKSTGKIMRLMIKYEYKNNVKHTSANRCACSGLDATCGLMNANIELICCPVW